MLNVSRYRRIVLTCHSRQDWRQSFIGFDSLWEDRQNDVDDATYHDSGSKNGRSSKSPVDHFLTLSLDSTSRRLFCPASTPVTRTEMGTKRPPQGGPLSPPLRPGGFFFLATAARIDSGFQADARLKHPRRPRKSSGPPLFELSLQVQGNNAHNASRSRSCPLDTDLNVRRLAKIHKAAEESRTGANALAPAARRRRHVKPRMNIIGPQCSLNGYECVLRMSLSG
jgi:hypothetical protein